MAKRHNNKGRSTGGGQFAPIPYSMAKHDAFRGLSGPALKVFFELRCRYMVRDGDGNNNGEITLSLDEGARLLKLGKATVKRALDELIVAGFVKRTKQGQWYGRKASCYAVTDCPLKKNPPTRDWQNSPDGKQKSVSRPNMFDSNGTISKPNACARDQFGTGRTN